MKLTVSGCRRPVAACRYRLVNVITDDGTAGLRCASRWRCGGVSARKMSSFTQIVEGSTTSGLSGAAEAA